MHLLVAVGRRFCNGCRVFLSLAMFLEIDFIVPTAGSFPLSAPVRLDGVGDYLFGLTSLPRQINVFFLFQSSAGQQPLRNAS